MNFSLDQGIYFGVPGKVEREELLYYYMVKYCSPKYYWKEMIKDWWHMPSSIFYKKKFMRMEEINDKHIEEVAEKTEGFSAREIEKFVINCHDIAFSQNDPVLTVEILYEALEKALAQHNQRKEWEMTY